MAIIDLDVHDGNGTAEIVRARPDEDIFFASIHQAAVGPLARNGLAVVQAPGLVDGTVTLTTRLIHSSGQWMECVMAAASKNMGPQAIGSTVTYLRRGGLAAMVGVVSSDDVDDDGEGAEGRGQRRDVPNAPQARANPGNNPHRGRHHHASWDADAGRFKAWTFSLSSNRCWLKDGLPAKRSNADTISGIRMSLLREDLNR